MNWRSMRAIMQKDLKVALQSKAVLLPMIIVPLFIVVLLPTIVALSPFFLRTVGPQATANTGELEELLTAVSPALRQELAEYDLFQAVIVLLLTYLFAPLYLIVPLMVSSVLAADSFAGEKERKTLEALVYSPTTDREMLLAKWLAAWLPGVAVALGSFVIYGLIANLAAWPTLGRIFFPNAMWLVLVLWVAPGVAALGLGATVVVSTRVNTFQEAYQTGSLIVLPIVILLIGQISGLFYLHLGLVALLGLVIWLIAAAIFWLAERAFRRGELLARL